MLSEAQRNKLRGNQANPSLFNQNQAVSKDNHSEFNDAKSVLYKPTETKKLGDKGLQIRHAGLDVQQAILTRVGTGFLRFVRKFSSSSVPKMKQYYLKAGAKSIFQRTSGSSASVSNLLVLLERNRNVTNGRLEFYQIIIIIIWFWIQSDFIFYKISKDWN